LLGTLWLDLNQRHNSHISSIYSK